MSNEEFDKEDSVEHCPIDGCDGEVYLDVGGAPHDRKIILRTTCSHSVSKCSACGSITPQKQLTHYDWPVQKYATGPGVVREVNLCSNCDTYRNITNKVPAKVLSRDYMGWWE